ncbi:membrane protein [Streptococcus pseudoporcinus]|uniref:Membrane protein n=3 Tax=Streptococcus pseudoporcinus TaxID=361101 RepID=A0A4U9XJY1_9STRE|nr:putative membrane protein [Streptococcus pseudoporcinus SPIN 20026]EHI65889.1 putative membrane protein [Streptococcus pseudoporcinus LQ 940-04]VEF94604.1 membrane protein [Streptococcus pseudoporcinus]VTS13584.1 membrane protein [Streptococcus pseudoporcinus]VTS20654.1 membrane protein [Streptococcus pseudoporcinus]
MAMEYINNVLKLISHLLFIGISFQLLISLFDWSKIIYRSPENIGKLKLFVFFLAIVLGYLVSHFILELIQMSQTLF